MKHMLIKSLKTIVFLSVCGFMNTTVPHVLIRSQSVDSVRELIGWTHKINLYDQGPVYGTFAVTPEYTQTFQGGKIAGNLFGKNLSNFCNNDLDCASIIISGSRVADRGAQDLLADYFGLPTDFQSNVTLNPRVQNLILDCNLYLGLDELLCGLWLRIHAPLVNTHWNLRMHETIVAEGTNSYVEGYFSRTSVPRNQLLNSFLEYLNSDTPYLNGDVQFLGLENGRVPSNSLVCPSSCSGYESITLDTTKLSDIQVALGWNFWNSEDYHFGLGVRGSMPTGTHINDTYLFQPVVGNGHHWEVGGMLTTHYTAWRSCDENRSCGFYVDVNLTTLLSTWQCRSFDLCGRGTNSKYMLAEKMDQRSLKINNNVVRNSANYNLQGNVVAANPPAFTPPVAPPNYEFPNGQFNDVFSPVANIAAAPVKVSVPFQADLTALFNFKSCGFEWDLGYNYWSTDCESFDFCTSRSIIPENTWSLKGDAHVFGFDAQNVGAPNFLPVPLSGTESNATIYTGTNYVDPNTVYQGQTNIGVDNARYAYGDGTSATGTGQRTLFSSTTQPIINVVTAAVDNPQTKTSVDPVYLSDCDLDIIGARKKGTTQKVFTHVSYTWEEHHCVVPYFGAGLKLEFASSTSDCNSICGTTSCAQACLPATECASNCFDGCGSECQNSAFSEWGIWLKGGISF